MIFLSGPPTCPNLKKFKDHFDDPSHPTHPSIHPIKLAPLAHPFVLLRKAIAGPRREIEREGGGLISERIFMKEIPLKMNRQTIIEN